MKKILSLILTLFCVLSLVGCGRSMDDIIKNESSITGVVEEVYNNSILISIQTDAYPYGAYCDVSLDAENKDDMVDFNIGDEVIVYYDGNIAESYPLQINTVYAISLKDPAIINHQNTSTYGKHISGTVGVGTQSNSSNMETIQIFVAYAHSTV